MKLCPQCQTENRDNARFCATCGATLPTSNQCPVCQSLLSPGMNFCPKCGHSLSGDRSATGPLPINTVLEGRYRIEQVISQGGMGTAYLAADDKFPGKQWVVKEMSDIGLATSDRLTAVRAFQQEADILSRLDHPHIPKVTDYFTQGSRHYLVMNYIKGQTLQAMLDTRSQPFPEEQVVDWGIQLCEILEYLHSQEPPVIFRDLKPLNIMVDQQGQLKLIDFGIARLFNPAKKTDTVQMGTIGFAPPEQYKAQGGQTDARSDIYALGATLHYLLTLRNPSDEPPFTFHQALPRQLNPDLSAEMEAVVMKAVEMERVNRYQSAAEMKKVLDGAKGAEAALAGLYQGAAAAYWRKDYEVAIRLWGQVWAKNPNYRDVSERIAQARAAKSALPPPPPKKPDKLPAAHPSWKSRPWVAILFIVVLLLAVVGTDWIIRNNTSSSTPTSVADLAPTRTPSSDAIVRIDGGLYAGPGFGYDVIGHVAWGDKLQVLGKNKADDWVKVVMATSDSSGERIGWLRFNAIDLNALLSSVAVETDIPPTPTPAVTSTPRPTRTPTTTPTPRPTRTPAPTLTLSPDAFVDVEAGNLRGGPGTNYDVLGQVDRGDPVYISSKDPGGDWVRVKVWSKTGWLAADLLDLRISLADIRVETAIPPTPMPSTPTATPTPKVCPPDPALVEINNMLTSRETFILDGPEHLRFSVGPGETRLCFAAGKYSRTWVTNDNSKDQVALEPSSQGCICWNLFSALQIPPALCLCSQDVADYSRP